MVNKTFFSRNKVKTYKIKSVNTASYINKLEYLIKYIENNDTFDVVLPIPFVGLNLSIRDPSLTYLFTNFIKLYSNHLLNYVIKHNNNKRYNYKYVFNNKEVYYDDMIQYCVLFSYQLKDFILYNIINDSFNKYLSFIFKYGFKFSYILDTLDNKIDDNLLYKYDPLLSTIKNNKYCHFNEINDCIKLCVQDNDYFSEEYICKLKNNLK